MGTFKADLEGSRARYLTRRIAIGDKEVLVFDGLFGRKTLETLYKFLRMSGGFRWIASDSRSAQGLKWQLHLSEQAAQMPFFVDVASLVQGLTERQAPPLSEVYANFNLFGEIFNSHIDSASGITALYCANVEWRDNWQGETVFFESGEPAYVVLPKPGRLTVFDGGLTHRGSPPTRDCYEPRFNIAFKFKPQPPESKRGRSKQPTPQWVDEIDAYMKRTRHSR